MTADLQARLREAAGPVAQPDIGSILGRASRRRRARAAGVTVAAVVAVGVLVGSQALTSPGTTLTADQSDSADGPSLVATGLATTVAAGSVDGAGPWQLVAYPVAPAPGRTESRLCSEFRGTTDGPQSCFPVISPSTSGGNWSFVERHLGRLFLVVAAEPGVSLQLDDRPLTAAPSEGELPVQFFVVELPDDPSYVGWLTSDSGSGQSVGGSEFLDAEGSRQLLSSPVTPGVELERLTSDDPAGDLWIPVAGTDGVSGYMNPSDLAGPSGEGSTVPVYGEDGDEIGIMGPCGFQADPQAPCDNAPTSTVVDGGG